MDTDIDLCPAEQRMRAIAHTIEDARGDFADQARWLMLALHDHDDGDFFPKYWPAPQRGALCAEIAQMAVDAICAHAALPEHIEHYVRLGPPPVRGEDAQALLEFAARIAAFAKPGDNELSDAERMAGLIRSARLLCQRFAPNPRIAAAGLRAALVANGDAGRAP